MSTTCRLCDATPTVAQRLCKRCYNRLRERGMLPRVIVRPAAPDGALACSRALGICRQHATDLIKSGRVQYVDGQWIKDAPRKRGRKPAR